MVGFVACYQVFEGAMSGKSRIESACSLSWFANWKPEQKVEFAKVLVRLENPQRSVYYTTHICGAFVQFTIITHLLFLLASIR